MRIAIVNDIHAGSALEHKGAMRAASHLAEDVLPKVISHIIQRHTPDVLVNLGDLIRSEKSETDLAGYHTMLANFSKLQMPVIHVVGNHEVKCMSLGDLEAAWKENGFEQRAYGVKTIKDFRIVWLAMEYPHEGPIRPVLPTEQLLWLQKVLGQQGKPVIIFTHCAIDHQDLTGNFFYEEFDQRKPTLFFLENQSDIRRIISESGTVRAVLQGHLHYFHNKMIDNIPYITCPAMVENICAPEIHNNFPEVYTIVDIDDRGLIAKSYSRDHCFAGTESL